MKTYLIALVNARGSAVYFADGTFKALEIESAQRFSTRTKMEEAVRDAYKSGAISKHEFDTWNWKEMRDTSRRVRKAKAPQDNIAFVTHLMEFSNHGALAQLFVIEALTKWSEMIAACKPEQVDTALINGAAWVGVAREIKDKLNARYGK